MTGNVSVYVSVWVSDRHTHRHRHRHRQRVYVEDSIDVQGGEDSQEPLSL